MQRQVCHLPAETIRWRCQPLLTKLHKQAQAALDPYEARQAVDSAVGSSPMGDAALALAAVANAAALAGPQQHYCELCQVKPASSRERLHRAACDIAQVSQRQALCRPASLLKHSLGSTQKDPHTARLLPRPRRSVIVKNAWATLHLRPEKQLCVPLLLSTLLQCPHCCCSASKWLWK